jgi:hypothetical protein
VDCSPPAFCHKPSCHATFGRCQTPSSLHCSNASVKICGCDGHAYGSECAVFTAMQNINPNHNSC